PRRCGRPLFGSPREQLNESPETVGITLKCYSLFAQRHVWRNRTAQQRDKRLQRGCDGHVRIRRRFLCHRKGSTIDPNQKVFTVNVEVVALSKVSRSLWMERCPQRNQEPRRIDH